MSASNFKSRIDEVQTLSLIRPLPLLFLVDKNQTELLEKLRTYAHHGIVLRNSDDFYLEQTLQQSARLYAASPRARPHELSYGALFYNSHSPMMLLRPGSGEIFDVNQAACNFYGWSREELLQMKIQSINQLSEAEVFEEMQRAKEEQRDQFFFRHKTADGTVKDVKISSNPVTINGEKLLYSIISDITEQMRVERALRDSEESLRITLNSIGDGVISTDIAGNVIRMNPVAERLTGWNLKAATGRPLEEVFYIINGDTRRRVENPVQRVLASGQIVGLANHTVLIAADGTEYHIADSAAPIRDREGAITGVVLIFRDYTEEYRKNRQVRESEQFLDAVFNSIQDGISVLNTDLSIRYVNPVMEEWYSGRRPLIGGTCYKKYHNREEPCENCPTLRSMESGQVESEIIPGVPGELEAEVEWIQVTSYPLKDVDSGRILGVVEFVRDITTSVRTEQELKESLRQQEILVKEIHHRVKNNLNIVVSLLKLQRDEIDSVDKAKEAFDESMKRIHSMALIHESLYRRDKLSEVEMDSYISSMIDQIKYSISSVNDIEYVLDLEKIYLDITKAVPCGIIINELITNAAKHAFSAHSEKKISISLKREGEKVHLSVSDNGVGLPKDFSIQESSSLGMSLVNILIKQLEGEISMDSRNGTTFVLQFDE
ncbi:MAG: PAS domain S-box protein [Spirochaetota bacterium]